MAKFEVICAGCGSRERREFYVEGPAMNFTCENCGPLAIDWPAGDFASRKTRRRFYRRAGWRTMHGYPRPAK